MNTKRYIWLTALLISVTPWSYAMHPAPTPTDCAAVPATSLGSAVQTLSLFG